MFTQLGQAFLIFAENEPPADTGGLLGQLMPILPIIAIGFLFYFMMMRPDQQRRKKHSAMLQELKKNDRVVTIGGIEGIVTNIQQDSGKVTIKIDEGNNTKISVLRSAIARVQGEDDEKEAKGS